MGDLAAAGWVWSALGRHMLWWEVGVVVASQAHQSGRLGAMGHCASTDGRSSFYNKQ